MYTSITIVRSIAEELRRLGVSEQRFLTAARVDETELADPMARIPLHRYDAVVRVAVALADEPALGLYVGASSLAASSVVGHLCLSCASLREMMTLFARYGRLLMDGASWTLREQGDAAIFTYDNGVLADDVAPFDADGWLAFAMRLGANFTAGELPSAVRLRRGVPAKPEKYRRMFFCEPEFGAPANEIVIQRRLLDVVNLHQDVTVAELLKRRAEELLAQTDGEAGFVERVRDLLRYACDVGALHVNAVAARLGMSERSLQRRLKRHGRSLVTLIEEAKREAACSAILRGSEPIKQVAEQFGFSEPSAFHRAFKRWTGLTPAEYRRRSDRA